MNNMESAYKSLGKTSFYDAAYSRKYIEKLMEDTGFTVVSSEKVEGVIFTVVGKKD